MLSEKIYNTYVAILNQELVPALGCTEPIAVAYASAMAKKVLGSMPQKLELRCSGNIIKNVKSVTVPNTGGLIGIKAAAVAGIVAGDAERGFEVLESVQAIDYSKINQLLGSDICSVSLVEGVDNLFIEVKAFNNTDSSEVRVQGSHTNIVYIARNGIVIKGFKPIKSSEIGDDLNEFDDGDGLFTIRNILKFAELVKISDIETVISAQIDMNTAISNEGLSRHYGADVGKTLLKTRGDDVRTRAKARAAAGSDARMGGCSLPVVINSGSGNQGITVSLPVIEYANYLRVSRDRLYRALVLANLVAIYQKKLIGKLSAYCGAVSAACGSGAGITYLAGGTFEEISYTITNTIANISGMVCDGAKASCAAKIASAVDAAIMAFDMAFEGKVFKPGEGLVGSDVERTIANIGRMGKVGMESTDVEILNMMIK